MTGALLALAVLAVFLALLGAGMARSKALAAAKGLAEAEFAEIIGWYETELASVAPPTALEWQPVIIGPTWQYENGWALPEFTLGWRVLAWCGKWLTDKRGNPWQFTPEQARFVLWYFAIDPESGDFLYHSAVLQRLKGWGKDPLAACLAISALFAEVTFDHWDGDVPMGREEPSAWVQVVAVNQEQTKNTMKLFPSLVSAEARGHYGIQIGKLNVYGLADTRQIEAVTSSPLAIEGGRPTLIIRNETQNWNVSNGGHSMAGAIEGNAAKSEGGAARILDICNAYRPGEDSVGERMRDAWEKTQGADAESDEFGLLYDSLEAPPEAPLSAEAAGSVVESIRGDAYWLSIKRIVASIMNTTNSASESRRKWYNQIVATEDARFDPLKLRLCATKDELQPGDEIVMFGDGSKSDDATGLVACRMSDGLTQVLHVQQPRRGQLVSRESTDLAVANAFQDYKVVGFWFDPSHALDDAAEGDERYWWPLCDEWALKYGRKLKHWAVKTGPSRHPIVWDMAIATHTGTFTGAVEQLDADIEAGAFRYRESGWLRRHMEQARRAPNKWGVSMQKNHRESTKKIDLAVCAAGARMLWRHVQLANVANKSKGAPGQGRVIVLS
jgi:hypothetical protein